MLGNSRQFVELSDDDEQQPAAARCSLRNLSSYVDSIKRQRPVFLAMLEALCPKLFYGWVVVFACGIGWWCVAPAATFGVGVYVDYWLTDPGTTVAQAFVLSFNCWDACYLDRRATSAPVFASSSFAAMEVQISRGLLSTYWTLALILTGLMSPLLGKLYAAWGARFMIAAAGAYPCASSAPAKRFSISRLVRTAFRHHCCINGPHLKRPLPHRPILGAACSHVGLRPRLQSERAYVVRQAARNRHRHLLSHVVLHAGVSFCDSSLVGAS
jgi:hypothetical protein